MSVKVWFWLHLLPTDVPNLSLISGIMYKPLSVHYHFYWSVNFKRIHYSLPLVCWKLPFQVDIGQQMHCPKRGHNVSVEYHRSDWGHHRSFDYCRAGSEGGHSSAVCHWSPVRSSSVSCIALDSQLKFPLLSYIPLNWCLGSPLVSKMPQQWLSRSLLAIGSAECLWNRCQDKH